ncbi:MAG: hypothetical protein M3Y33_14055 [Actinomycetota bacterium]|nr:hypothetical protein [Actinomycetota bacterium]
MNPPADYGDAVSHPCRWRPCCGTWSAPAPTPDAFLDEAQAHALLHQHAAQAAA